MSQEPDRNQISHLICLIDDRDPFVRDRVQQQLIAHGEDALPFLQIAAKDENPFIRSKALETIRAIFPRQLGEKFRQLVTSARGGDVDLETGVALLMKFGYPETEPEVIRRTLDNLAAELAERLGAENSPTKIVEELTQFLFTEKEFSGNRQDYLDPDNSYFNRVLERRKGIPITLSVLCILICQRLHLPVVGVGLPGHYIVKYDSAKDPIFFDPFHKGRLLTRENCVQLVEHLGYRFEEYHLSQASHRETLVRMMNNLVVIYNDAGKSEEARQLTDYVKILLGNTQNHPSQSPNS